MNTLKEAESCAALAATEKGSERTDVENITMKKREISVLHLHSEQKGKLKKI